MKCNNKYCPEKANIDFPVKLCKWFCYGICSYYDVKR